MTIYRVVIALDLLRVPNAHISTSYTKKVFICNSALMVCTAHQDCINMARR